MSSSATLKLKWCTYQAAAYACKNWHYSRSLPTGKTVKIGVFENDKFIGVIIFSYGANRNIGKPFGLSNLACVELTRVAINSHHLPVSKMLSVALRLLREQSPGIRLVISYADLNHGHIGIIYQANGWSYLGWVPAAPPDIKLRGRVVSARTIFSKYGTASLEWLKQYIDPHAAKIKDRGKHKYAYALDVSLKPIVDSLAKAYPKRPKDSSEPLPDQGKEGGAAPTRTLQI